MYCRQTGLDDETAKYDDAILETMHHHKAIGVENMHNLQKLCFRSDGSAYQL